VAWKQYLLSKLLQKSVKMHISLTLALIHPIDNRSNYLATLSKLITLKIEMKNIKQCLLHYLNEIVPQQIVKITQNQLQIFCYSQRSYSIKNSIKSKKKTILQGKWFHLPLPAISYYNEKTMKNRVVSLWETLSYLLIKFSTII
jgi:hypothetical protein